MLRKTPPCRLPLRTPCLNASHEGALLTTEACVQFLVLRLPHAIIHEACHDPPRDEQEHGEQPQQPDPHSRVIPWFLRSCTFVAIGRTGCRGGAQNLVAFEG